MTKHKKKFHWGDFMSGVWDKFITRQKKLIEDSKELRNIEEDSYKETMKKGVKEIGKKKAEKEIKRRLGEGF